MPDIKYIPSEAPLSSRDYYRPQSVFAAGVTGLENGLKFGAELSAKIQETQRENDPEKLRADQLKRDLENAQTEQLIADAKAKYERDQIYAAQERQTIIDARIANTIGQDIQNKYGDAREQTDIAYKRAAIGNMGADNEIARARLENDRLQQAIEARKMYGKEEEGSYVAKPRGVGSSSDLPSINSPAPADPNADIKASLDEEIASHFKVKQRVAAQQKYAEVAAANNDLNNQAQEFDNSRARDTVTKKYQEEAQVSFKEGSPEAQVGSLGQLNEAYKIENRPGYAEGMKKFFSKTINDAGGIDSLEKTIDSSFANEKDPEKARAEAKKIVRKSAALSGDPSLLNTDQKVLTDAGFSTNHVADPEDTLNKIGATIAGGIGSSDDPEVDQAIGASEYLRAAREASKNGTQGFRVDNGRTATTGTSPDTAGGNTQSQAHLVFTGDDGTVSNAPIPSSPKEWADLSLVKKVNKSQAQSAAASQGIKQQVQTLQQNAQQQQSQAAANPNTSSASTTFPDVPSEKAEPDRPGLEILNANLEPDPNGEILRNHNNGVTITNKREGPTPEEYKNRKIDEIYNSQLSDITDAKASRKVLDDATKNVQREMADFEKSAAVVKKDEDLIKSSIQSGDVMAMKMEKLISNPLMTELLGPGIDKTLRRSVTWAGEGANYLQEVDKMKAEIISDFIQKVKSVGATNTEGEMQLMAQIGITARTAPQTAIDTYKVYKSILDRRKEQLWLIQCMRKDYQDPSITVSNYSNDPVSFPVIFNSAKYDGNTIVPGHENEEDYIKNENYQTAAEWLGFKDPKKERERIAAAKASAPQAPSGGGGNNGGFPIKSGAAAAGSTALGAASSSVPTSTTTTSIPPSTTTVPAVDADVANTSTLASQADLAKNASIDTNTTTANTTVDSRFDPSEEGAKLTNEIVNRISKWVGTTSVGDAGKSAKHASTELERKKQDKEFRAVVDQMKAELNTSIEPIDQEGYTVPEFINDINPLHKSKIYDPGLIDYALEAVTPQFIENFGNKIIETGVLPISERVSALFGGPTGEQFYQNYAARKQARQEIFEDSKIEDPYRSFFGEIMAFAVLGKSINEARLGAVKAIADKFPAVSAAIDYYTGGALTGKTGKFIKATKDAIAGGAEDTAAIRLMDDGSDVGSTLAFTSAFRGAMHILSPVMMHIAGAAKSLFGKLNDTELMRSAARMYADRGGTEAKLKLHVEQMQKAKSMGDIETLAMEGNELAQVFVELKKEPGGNAAMEEIEAGILKTGNDLSATAEKQLPKTRPVTEIASDVRESIQNKVADTIDKSAVEQEGVRASATKAHEKVVSKDLAAQRAEINRQTKTNINIRNYKLKELINKASDTTRASEAVNDFITEAGLDPVNLNAKATGGSPTGTLADARIKKVKDFEEAIQPELEKAYEYAEKDLDGLNEDAVHKFDEDFRAEFPSEGPKLIQQNARELELTTERVEKTIDRSKSDADLASMGPNDSITETVSTGLFELAPTFRSLDEFRQLINRTPLNQKVKNNMINRVREFVQQQAEQTGLKKGWYDRFLDSYGNAQVAKANVIAQRVMLQDIKATMQAGIKGQSLYNRFAAKGGPNEQLEAVFGVAEAKNIRKALQQHDNALKAIQDAQKAKPTPLTKSETGYSEVISEAERNIRSLEKAKEQMANKRNNIPTDFPGISADLSTAAKQLGGVGSDIAKTLIEGKTEFTKGLMDAMGADAHLLEESVVEEVVKRARNNAKSFDTSGKAGTSAQLKMSPDEWTNVQNIIGKEKSDILENYIRQQTNIKKSIELFDKTPGGKRYPGFLGLLRGPNPIRRLTETPMFLLDIVGKLVTNSGSLNNKAYRLIKNLGNPDFAKANEYAADILKMIKTVEDSQGNKFTKIIEEEWGSTSQFAAEAVYSAFAVAANDKNLSKAEKAKLNRK